MSGFPGGVLMNFVVDHAVIDLHVTVLHVEWRIIIFVFCFVLLVFFCVFCLFVICCLSLKR